MTGRFELRTFGCKANSYDSQVLVGAFRARGWAAAEPGEAADIVVINSCTVTHEAERQARKLASRLQRENPRAMVVMTGCAAEVDPDRMAAARGVHFVVGNQDKYRLVDLVVQATRKMEGEPDKGTILGGVSSYGELRARHPMDREWPLPEMAFVTPDISGKNTRVFLKIQEGCDAFCTFCIIPFGRGPSRSLPVSDIVERVRELEDMGTKEVVLTGTNLGEYGGGQSGKNLSPPVGFEDLLEALLRDTSVERIRLSSLDPSEITPRLLALMEAEPRLCPHLHISLQSPHSKILRRMKRNYRAAEVERALYAIEEMSERIERERGIPGGVFVGMDVIAGFPGETEEIFQWSYAQFRTLPWNRLHIFPYSERQGTAATRLDGVVPVPERKARVRQLMALSTARLKETCEAIIERERAVEALVEGAVKADGPSMWASCTTANYFRIVVPCENPEGMKNTSLQVWPRAVRVHERAGDVTLVATLEPGIRSQRDSLRPDGVAAPA